MKKILLAISSLVMIVLGLASCTKQVPVESFSEQSLDISCEDGKFTVNGSFNCVGAISTEYTLVCLNEKDGASPLEIRKTFPLLEGVNSFELIVPVTAKNQTLTAFVSVGEEEIVSPASRSAKSLRILSVGNSFSVDAQQHLYGIAKDMGYDNVVLGNLYIGGCSLQGHYSTYVNERATYM